MSKSAGGDSSKSRVKIGPIGAIAALGTIIAFVVLLVRLGATDSPRAVGTMIGTLIGVLVLSSVAAGFATRLNPGLRHAPGIAFASVAIIASVFGMIRVTNRVGVVQTPEIVQLQQVTKQMSQVAYERSRQGEFPLLTTDDSIRLILALRQAASSTRGTQRHLYNTEADMLEQMTTLSGELAALLDRPDVLRAFDPTTLRDTGEAPVRLRALAEIKPRQYAIMEFASEFERNCAVALAAKGVSSKSASEHARNMASRSNMNIVAVMMRTESEVVDSTAEMTKILARNIGNFRINDSGDLVVGRGFPESDFDRYKSELDKVNAAVKKRELMSLNIRRER